MSAPIIMLPALIAAASDNREEPDMSDPRGQLLAGPIFVGGFRLDTWGSDLCPEGSTIIKVVEEYVAELSVGRPGLSFERLKSYTYQPMEVVGASFADKDDLMSGFMVHTHNHRSEYAPFGLKQRHNTLAVCDYQWSVDKELSRDDIIAELTGVVADLEMRFEELLKPKPTNKSRLQKFVDAI